MRFARPALGKRNRKTERKTLGFAISFPVVPQSTPFDVAVSLAESGGGVALRA
jgi:hypothetical protein